ncbi:hypothetical protein OsI_20849 [Oryza sativa Indica Group]|jgi:hypothetical protein|uniref:DUF4220 domain-containing protein n=2 Tax=Oryza TaxID=4527 RepID=Q9XEM3_ORYSI|nr:unknown [Oryza sativa Indica Group]EAY98894.1 hypothetical protein OsI_20849 [Oryza sativa Indica Group]
MGSSSVVLWWEEWQLRILVLGSLFLQCFLAFAAVHRRRSIPASLRFFIWLAYLGSDALAIYALATLFNRHKTDNQGGSHVLATLVSPQGKGGGDDTGLEVFWAPVLLLHLAGPDSITSYNIEDNELWRRHVLTVISQVTVSLYVFCKSWSGENKLLRAAVLLFIAGTLKCIDKPMALKSASIYGLVTSSPFHDQKSQNNDQGENRSLEAYIQEAKGYFSNLKINDVYTELVAAAQNKDLRVMPFWLFVDLASTLCHRLRVLRFFLVLDNKSADSLLQTALCGSFVRLYTKKSMLLSYFWAKDKRNALISTYSHLNRLLAVCLTISAVALFHQSHKQGYNNSDVKVTYTLLWCTAALEVYALFGPKYKFFTWCKNVAQYNLVGFFARDQTPTRLLKLASCFWCKDYVDQHWYVNQCSSSFAITELVIEQVKDGWKNYIEDTSTYWMFNDRRGQLTIQHELCDEELCKSLDVPFDESIIVWHIATDICFYEGAPAANHHHLKAATRCREISNYMLYLLVVNPDILMSGTRANILSNTCKELRSMFEDEKPPSDESDLTREIHRRAQSSNVDAAATEELIPRASKLASQLLAMDGDKRWKVMQGVWVEMLCFSASRCRGYLHAKSLGQGGEYLSYVWLLLWYMGLESVAERQQRSDFRSHVERVASRQLPCTETESSQEPEIQEEEGAVVPLFQEGDIGVAVRSNVEDEEAGAVTLEIQDDEEAATTAHASKATVPGDNNV